MIHKTSSIRILLTLLAMTASLLAVSFARAAESGPVYTEPLGIGLEAVHYPYSVQYLPLTVDGQRLRMAYMDVPPSGHANGETVVLLHGKNFFGAYWENTIKTLSEAGYRVLAPDQIGFGKSSKPDLHYSFDLLAENTAKLLDDRGIQKAVIVGHSMGGMLAVRFARNYSNRTTKLILENPIGLEDYRFKVPQRSLEQVYEGELGNTDVEKIRAYYKTYLPEWKPELLEPYVAVQARVALSGEFLRWARASALTYQMIYQQPVRHEFPLITVPTLLVIGQADRTTIGRNLVTPEILKTLGQYPQLGRDAARDIPQSRLVELEGIGHIPHLEAPERFHRALLEFLKS